MPSRFFLLLLVLATVAMAKDPTTRLRSVEVIADTDANQDLATAIDLVFVYDRDSAVQLPKTGPEWFEKKAALQNLLANRIDVVSLQVPPGTAAHAVTLPARSRRAIAVVAYSNYLATGGQPVVSLTPFRHAVIRLRNTSVDVTEQPKPAHP